MVHDNRDIPALITLLWIHTIYSKLCWNCQIYVEGDEKDCRFVHGDVRSTFNYQFLIQDLNPFAIFSSCSIKLLSSAFGTVVQANGRCFFTVLRSWKNPPLGCFVASGDKQSHINVSAPSAAERKRLPIWRWKSGIEERTAGVSAQPNKERG